MKIEINLLPGSKKKRGGLSFEMPDIQELLKQFNDPLLLGAIGAWVIGLGAVGTIWIMEKDTTAGLEPELARLRQEERQFTDLINDRDRQVALRDTLRENLEALREIDGDRYVWPHILDEVARALPDFTWIVSLDAVAVQDQIDAQGNVVPAAVRFSLEGRTSENQGVTRFLSQLESSPWLRDVETGGTQTVLEMDQAVISFDVTATFRIADSSVIRTVPLVQIEEGGRN